MTNKTTKSKVQQDIDMLRDLSLEYIKENGDLRQENFELKTLDIYNQSRLKLFSKMYLFLNVFISLIDLLGMTLTNNPSLFITMSFTQLFITIVVSLAYSSLKKPESKEKK